MRGKDAAMTDPGGPRRVEELAGMPTGELVKQLSEQAARLVREELRLAQLEMTEKGKRAGLGAGLFGGAGLVALYGAGALVAAAVAALALALPVWAAAVIVGVALLAVAGVLALVGKKQVSQAVPLTPERTVDSVRTDVEDLKGRARP
jgi:putative superfamily III holin-X